MTENVASSPHATPCTRCPLRKLPLFRRFEPAELAFVQWFKSGEIVVEEGETILDEGSGSPHLFTVLSGWAFRYKALPDGRRQILNFALPGDFLGVQATMFGEMQHSVEALSRTVLCVFPRERLWKLYEQHPALAFDLTWLIARSERMLDDTLLSIGRRSAQERMAFVLLHLFQRARELGLTADNKVQFPFTQQHIADALGLSLVHTNKTLKRLTATGAIQWKEGKFEMRDEARLLALASHDPAPPSQRPFL